MGRLHNEFGYKRGKWSGRTFDLLVEAINTLDFFDGEIYFVVNKTALKHTMSMFFLIAREMGHTVVRGNNNEVILSSNRYFRFIICDDAVLIGKKKAIIFYDHYVVPIGVYCYEPLKIVNRDMVMNGFFCEGVPVMMTHECIFYGRGEDEDPLMGVCSLLDYEVTDQCKECGINIDDEYF